MTKKHDERPPSTATPHDCADRPRNDDAFWIADRLIEPNLNQITANGETRIVERQTMRVLLCLAANQNQAVTRDAILKDVWVRGAPNDEGLTQAICKLRKALGDRPGAASIILTIRKVGYRLVAPVSATPVPLGDGGPAMDSDRAAQPAVRSIRIRIHGRWLAAAGLLFVAILFVSRMG